jgi:hypothetical protein
MSASGSVGKSIVFSIWKGKAYVRSLVIPQNPNSFKQQAIRNLITLATQAWSTGATVGAVTIGVTYKAAYDAAASGRAFSGFNMFIRDCVGKNYDATTSPYFDGTLVAPTEPGDNLA